MNYNYEFIYHAFENYNNIVLVYVLYVCNMYYTYNMY